MGNATPSTDASTPDRFRSLMAGFPTGVSIVTAIGDASRLWGMTCSALCSVTLHPPTLLVGIREQSPTLTAILSSGVFTVNLLHAQGRDTADLFASGAPDRFSRVTWALPDGASGPHLMEAAHAVADCRVSQTVHVGGQRVVFGEVRRITVLAEPKPLLYGLRQYSAFPDDNATGSPTGPPDTGVYPVQPSVR
ncbi:flavin reductase family protein [Streptomyces sp. 110]|uniref:Flavin reductase family protein n=1 Tax=Streptomyces endocoffeicus TaxID=2898945 RepID=A0ABS1PTL9_9ACTN|nr:flavin reductase family protein [Streptomyces endocoffeicus]MBL1115315.1 flavin reductase family protein [Streptomyces endocoffeicus]